MSKLKYGIKFEYERVDDDHVRCIRVWYSDGTSEVSGSVFRHNWVKLVEEALSGPYLDFTDDGTIVWEYRWEG